MRASFVSLLRRPFDAIARRMSLRAPTLAWAVEDGVSVAVWAAPEVEADKGTVSNVRLEIRPGEVPRQPYVLTVNPEGYMPASFSVGDLETARSLAAEQLVVARRLPAIPAAAEPVLVDTASFDPPSFDPPSEGGVFHPAEAPAAANATDGRHEAA